MSNRLQQEASPYLRQHADNPVDWYPWGDEALERARREARPILLSIGYAACHWCHVMADECFADPEVAAVMNRLFVNVKVDREERPDLDHLYQRTQQLLSGRPGGWPLTVFLAPDQTPFFSGTYFPKSARHGLIGFVDLMQRIDAAWRERRDDLERQNAELRSQLARLDARAVDETAADPLRLAAQARATLVGQADPERGGLGRAPKFPHPVEWRLLLETGDRPARETALAALRAMARGGLQDHAGGGFYRYSVDDDWQIPHFEKMLYDNALLLPLYAQAATATGDPLFADAARGIVDWLQREMTVLDGDEVGFGASLDADADHEEGAFYVWTRDQARAAVGEALWPLAEAAFNFTQPANFERHAWHLRRNADDDQLAQRFGGAAAVAGGIARIREALRAGREQRVRPALDDKRLTAWNALMIAGLARAAAELDAPGWTALARRALDTIRRHHWQDGRLGAVRQQGGTRLNAYLDDHAFLLDALVTLLATDWRDEDLAFARELAAVLVGRFQDGDGLLWMTSDDHEALLTRPREVHDHATPAGAAVALGALAQLGAIAGEPRWNSAAERGFRALLPEAADYPAAAASFWLAARWITEPPVVVTVRAPRAALAAWRDAVAVWLPGNGLYLGIAAASDELAAAATLCLADRCLPPVATADALAAQWRREQREQC